jgi:hypothetical protein
MCNNWGLLVIAIGMLIFLAANVGAELFLMRFSIVVSIYGLTVYLFGWPISRTITIALKISDTLFELPLAI